VHDEVVDDNVQQFVLALAAAAATEESPALPERAVDRFRHLRTVSRRPLRARRHPRAALRRLR
jgi:hypothetical protein